MPTCSQAKIISNLEYDISKRVISIINREQELTTVTRIDKNNSKTQQRRNSRTNVECQYCATKPLNDANYYRRRASFHAKNNHKLPAITNTANTNNNNNNNGFIARRDSVPINFLFNSNYRNKSADTRVAAGYARNSPTKGTHRNTPPEDLDNDHDNSETNSSWCSSGSDNYIPRVNNNSDQEASDREPVPQIEYTKRYNNTTIFSCLPKLALEMELIDDSQSDNTSSNDDENNKSEKRHFSISGAKRLLALASIRPSRTFHKELTIEEAEILKKYYEIIKPKINTNTIDSEIYNQNLEKQKLIETPILYNSGKINYDTFSCLEMFLTEYKSEITSGKYQIEYNSSGYNGFILKNVETESIVEFPPNVHDTFVALAISINSSGNPNLDENHILASINWNDTRHILAPKKARSKKSPKSNEAKKLNLPTVNLDAIKELSRMLRSVVEPKLLKKVTESGMDVSHLPGGLNYDLPPSQQFEYTNNNLIKLNQQGMPEKTGKLKNVVYKKLKEKVSSTKVMWFSAPPVFKSLSVVFEYAGFDLTHEAILEDVNKCLSSVNGQVEEIEFVPRSVHFGSVHVQNLWILTLNHKEAKFYTISHGIEINGERVVPKSYDDYIFTEYEKYIRTEKYKIMIKNHEKALSKHSRQ